MASSIYLKFSELIILAKEDRPFSITCGVSSDPPKSARDSYRLDKVLYESLNVAIASSFNFVKALQDEVKTIDKTIKGINPAKYESLISIPGVGPMLASGILYEIGTITSFDSHNSLAKYASVTWRVNESGNYSSDNTRMTKTGNKYLRYYLIEAANNVKNRVS